ncbi:MAG: PAS domain-containing protein, partial [Kiritimatiellia bacterium]|nr:PAS domain-containing protein [Kiritimatiellia bacterium]
MNTSGIDQDHAAQSPPRAGTDPVPLSETAWGGVPVLAGLATSESGPIEPLLWFVLAGLLGLLIIWGRFHRRVRREDLMTRRILEHTPDAVLIVGVDFRILRMTRLPFRTDPENTLPYLNRPLCDLPALDAPALRTLETMVARTAAGESLPPETCHLTSGSGPERYGRIQAARIPGDHQEPDTVLLVISDTTDLERSQRERLAAERKHHAIIEQLPAITYTITLGHTARTTFISPQVQSILGFTPEEWTGDPELWIRQLHPDDRDRILEEIRRCNRTLESFDLLYRSFAKDGRTVWFENRAVYLPGENGDPTLAQGVMLDITARREAEAALEESGLREKQLLKMEALGRLAGGISHDMNNLLTPILGFSRLVREHPDLPAQCRDDLHEVIRAAERGTELTKQLLAFGRKQPIQVQSVDVNRVVTDIEPILLRTLGEDIALNIHLCEDPGTIMADAALMEQVLMNLAV